MNNEPKHPYAQRKNSILRAHRIRGDAPFCVSCPFCGIGQIKRREGYVCAYCGAEVVGMWTVAERLANNKQMELGVGI